MYILAVSATAAGTTTQPDYIALAMVAVLALIVVGMVIRKKAALKEAAQAKEFEVSESPESTQEASLLTAPGSAGAIKIHDVDPKTAAMLMAIVADKMGKPLNELRFISIKEVK